MAGEWRKSAWGDEISLEYGKALRGHDQSAGEYRVYALDTASGELLWKFDTNQPVKSFISIENGRVYCGANNGALYCLEIATGR